MNARKETVPVHVQVPVGLKERLELAADRDGGRSQSSAVRRALQDYTDRILGREHEQALTPVA